MDILHQTNYVLHNYLSVIWDPSEYLRLDDTILSEIRLSDHEMLSKAKQLVKRFDNNQCGMKVETFWNKYFQDIDSNKLDFHRIGS